MPWATPRPCRQPGCAALTHERYCTDHKRAAQQQQDAARGSANERGYTWRWRKAALAWLKAHPLCALCLLKGITTLAVLVDHIVPHKGDDTLFWDRNNWQSLCKHCHDEKTAREDGGFGRPVASRG